ncbi:MAG: bifunctional 4-hydroxy-2-oxoglutarate aldolase/2-dehydro-3-deoxy-phosphogluconate aldolase [Acholeplasmataceae bacterium]|nr:bifunctional 4-hydroxy-2-oxoglutarate aldolase/2-dehydro-3-deoxy-phosphogluconate aldolase [Acholeplasmataceae bacterium]
MTLTETIMKAGLIAVIRASTKEEAKAIAHACLKGGIRILEITFTVPDASEIIADLIHETSDLGVIIGAGTVTNKETAEHAKKAGAKFIVSPGFDLMTFEYAKAHDLFYIPGCLTPTEIMTAMNHGLSLIKLFPGSAFGPSYIKALKGPFPTLQIMPTGGVSLDNIKTWMDAGAVSLGIGSDLWKHTNPDFLEGITVRARSYVTALEHARKERL